MDAQIRVSSGDEAAVLADLWEWLRYERALAGRVRAVRRPTVSWAAHLACWSWHSALAVQGQR